MNENLESHRVFIHPDGRMDRKNTGLYLGCAPKTLADWASKGKGPEYVMIGGRAFYFQDDLSTWIESRRKRSSADR
ncbi:MAG: helix-turn-helix domain-containing protein [Rhodospirillaceae bacterium]|jgi:hypothetical protein|nr:helix-turn-helix domain-containing protein [Rhodospirillaceae bacterium]MBT6537555.1 helix-turn-helix domain-containing protein [Rhodospirillaceae bacterium]